MSNRIFDPYDVQQVSMTPTSVPYDFDDPFYDPIPSGYFNLDEDVHEEYIEASEDSSTPFLNRILNDRNYLRDERYIYDAEDVFNKVDTEYSEPTVSNPPKPKEKPRVVGSYPREVKKVVTLKKGVEFEVSINGPKVGASDLKERFDDLSVPAYQDDPEKRYMLHDLCIKDWEDSWEGNKLPDMNTIHTPSKRTLPEKKSFVVEKEVADVKEYAPRKKKKKRKALKKQDEKKRKEKERKRKEKKRQMKRDRKTKKKKKKRPKKRKREAVDEVPMSEFSLQQRCRKKPKVPRVVIRGNTNRSTVEVHRKKTRNGKVTPWAFSGIQMITERGGIWRLVIRYGREINDIKTGKYLLKFMAGATKVKKELDDGKLEDVELKKPASVKGGCVYLNPKKSGQKLKLKPDLEDKQMGHLFTLCAVKNTVARIDPLIYAEKGEKSGDLRFGVHPKKGGVKISKKELEMLCRPAVGLRKFKEENGIEYHGELIFVTPIMLSLISLGSNVSVKEFVDEDFEDEDEEVDEETLIEFDLWWRQSANNKNKDCLKKKVDEVIVVP